MIKLKVIRGILDDKHGASKNRKRKCIFANFFRVLILIRPSLNEETEKRTVPFKRWKKGAQLYSKNEIFAVGKPHRAYKFKNLILFEIGRKVHFL